MSYDPVLRHQAIEKLVTRGTSDVPERKYYRWRVDRWYGGIVTADAVGCGLYCKFCWVSDFILTNPTKVGEFYTPMDTADRITKLLKKSGLRQLRISGGEPTIGRDHLLCLLDFFQGKGYRFILETNGILLGYDQSYAEDLSKYNFLHVRVSLKGYNGNEFASLTNAKPDGFDLQIESLKNLIDAGVSCHPAVMTSFSSRESVVHLKKRLSNIKLERSLEIEELISYPKVARRLRKYGIERKTS